MTRGGRSGAARRSVALCARACAALAHSVCYRAGCICDALAALRTPRLRVIGGNATMCRRARILCQLGGVGRVRQKCAAHNTTYCFIPTTVTHDPLLVLRVRLRIKQIHGRSQLHADRLLLKPYKCLLLNHFYLSLYLVPHRPQARLQL